MDDEENAQSPPPADEEGLISDRQTPPNNDENIEDKNPTDEKKSPEAENIENEPSQEKESTGPVIEEEERKSPEAAEATNEVISSNRQTPEATEDAPLGEPENVQKEEVVEEEEETFKEIKESEIQSSELQENLNLDEEKIEDEIAAKEDATPKEGDEIIEEPPQPTEQALAEEGEVTEKPSQPVEQVQEGEAAAVTEEPAQPIEQSLTTDEEGKSSEVPGEDVTEKKAEADHVDSEVEGDEEKEEVSPEIFKREQLELQKQQEQQEEEEQTDATHRQIVVKPKMPEDFFYDIQEFISKPVVTLESGLPENLIVLQHSMGYDCLKRDNIHLLDPNHLIYLAGNLVVIFDMKQGSLSYLRSSSGGGIGSLAVHPSRQFFVVAEKGIIPNALVYEYPSLKLYRILRAGTKKAFSHCKFSPDGELLATVGSDPDYMLTVWDWRNEQIILRSKAFSQDIFFVSWSQDLEGILTTSGTGHIRFWKMADTFTGLKLQGFIGKFGKTEISDIEGFVELPDGKVLSGCEWGNMLVWDGGLIKVQISRKGKRSCHQGPIQQIVMDEGELMTVGYDGYIRTWDFDAIDTAEASDENSCFELEPMNELRVDQDVKLKRIVKNIEKDTSIWYAQDAEGHIWRLDLSFSHTSSAPERIASFHAGKINDCSTSPCSYLCATIGDDGTVKIYDLVSHKLLTEKIFLGCGTKVIWAPQKLDPKGKTLITGFSDGVIRILQFGENPEQDPTRKAKNFAELTLVEVFKPHNKPVIDICLDDDGQILATTGEDNTIFFFHVTQRYSPIGFVKLHSSAVNMQWCHPVGKTPAGRSIASLELFAFMKNGQVAKINCPDPSFVDHSKTYELQETKPKYLYQFQSIKSRLRHEEEMDLFKKELDEKTASDEKERLDKLERGLITEEEVEIEREKRIEEVRALITEREEEWVPYYPETPSPVLRGLVDRHEKNRLWFLMGDYDAGYLYSETIPNHFAGVDNPDELQPQDPSVAIPILDNPTDAGINVLVFTQSGKRALCGMMNGMVRLHNLEEAYRVESVKSQWSLPMHDNHYGRINAIAMSYDEKFIITVGADGNFFIYDFMDEDLQEKKVKEFKAKIPSARLPGPLPDDIDDPAAYSIEEHKQKSEYDRMVKLAEEKKSGVRRRIVDMRKEFKSLKDLNDQLPNGIRLSKQRFELVPDLRQDLIFDREEKISMVKKELAWELEKHNIALKKLQKRYHDYVEFDLVEVLAFASEHKVCTIRTAKLSDAFLSMKRDVTLERTLLTDKEATRLSTLDIGKSNLNDDDKERTGAGDGLLKNTLTGARGERIQRALQKLEEKKKKRSRRKEEWNDFFQKKPADDYEDPADMAAIKEAKEKMGDFKLKSAKDYVVPEHLRMNTIKAKQKQLLLEERLYELKSKFNNKVMRLRDKKLGIIDSMQKTFAEVEEIQSTLDAKDRVTLPQLPTMSMSEIPEKKFEYTRESLMAFKEELERRRIAQIKGEENTGTAFGNAAKKAVTAAPPIQRPVVTQSGLNKPTSSAAAPIVEQPVDPSEDNGPSQWQLEQNEIKRIRQLYRRDFLLENIEKQLRTFDAELRLLRHEKFELDIKVKKAELRQLILFQEYLLLKEFEKSESGLSSALMKKTEEKSDMEAKVADAQQRIEAKKKDIEKLQEKERVLHESFKHSLGDGNKFADYLTKVFKKKIKRKKKTAEGEDEEDSEEDSDSDDSELDESEEESDEEGNHFDLDMCPPECDQQIYDSTCQLREKRLDIEEDLAEEKRIMESYKKELENLQKKQKIIESGLKAAENELEVFQMEKQQKLNELDSVVTLRLSQILVHDQSHIPNDLSACLVFEAANLYALRRRIDTLKDEEKQQKQQRVEAKSRHAQLIKNKKRFQTKIEEMHEVCDSEMTRKFGKVDDLEKLEAVIVNPKIEELTEKMLQEQDKMLKEQAEFEDLIREAKDALIEKTRENTKYLSQMLMLFTEKEEAETKLDSKQKNLGAEYQTTLPTELEEVQRLMQLVEIQAQELNALKEEIGMLSRKGGHMLPPMPTHARSNGGGL